MRAVVIARWQSRCPRRLSTPESPASQGDLLGLIDGLDGSSMDVVCLDVDTSSLLCS